MSQNLSFGHPLNSIYWDTVTGRTNQRTRQRTATPDAAQP
ncbi:hypothetical protein JOE64_002252 [Microbacterium dextranolyticum]|nr:hypothetical protein [Microbacterium dextranolyticum]